MNKKLKPGDTYAPILTKLLRIMRLMILMFILGINSLLAASGYSQSTKISLKMSDSRVEEVLNQIESKSEFFFLFNQKQIDVNRKVSIEAKDEKISDILDDLFAGTDVKHQVIDRQIVLTTTSVTENQQQGKKVVGKITDSSGGSLPGVSIVVKGTTTGVITDNSGKYSLSDIPENAILQFSFVGMKTQEIKIGTQTSINLVLVEETIGLEEVVAIGYGTTTQRMSIGAIEMVKAKNLADIPAAQFMQKLQGQMAGVQINQVSGKPGQGMQVRVRGAASISTGSNPLYVVDGFPIVGDISNINPDEIESITVLKDAASTALYGSRAAFGVVIVITKSAKPGQTNISVDAYTGVQNVPQKGRPDMMNGTEWAQFRKENFEDLGQPVPSVFQNPAQYGKGYDWYDAMLRSAIISNYSVSLRTDKDNFSSSLTASFYSQDGVLLNSNYKRFSARANNLFKVTNNLRLGLNVAPTYNYGNSPSSDGTFSSGGGLLNNALLTPPIVAIRNADGSLPVAVTTPGVTTFPTPNWVRSVQDTKNTNNTNRLLSNAYVEYEPVNNLVVKSSINLDLGQTKGFYFQPSTAGRQFASAPSKLNANLAETRTSYYSWLFDNTINYSKQINNHNFEVLAGFNSQRFYNDFTSISGSNFPDDRVQTINAALIKNNASQDVQEWSLVSYLARVNYNYKGKYLLGGSIRRDGSSRFGQNNKYGNFPAVSGGWILSEESFAKNFKWLSFLKVRGSYGVTGNNNIGNYTQYATVATGVNSPFGNTTASGIAVVSLGNEELGWEKTRQMDLGLDISLLKNRINITYDYYDKNTSGLLYTLAVPNESGFTSLTGNVGEVKFWGHELAVNTKNLIGRFTWNTNFNIAFSDNKVLALSGLSDHFFSENGAAVTMTKVGQRIGQFWGLIQDGVYTNQSDYDKSPKNQNSQVGTIKFRDLNGDGVIKYGEEEGDKTVIGNPFPKFVYGMTNTFAYKNFDLSIVVAGSYGNKIARMTDQGTTNLDGVFNVLKNVKNRWRSETNPGDGKYGKTTANTGDERDLFHTRFVYDGSYLTIKNITLGYMFPFQNIKYIKSIRLYTSIQQAFVFTKYNGNPEINVDDNGNPAGSVIQGVDYSAYPIPRTISFGLNVNFN